MLLTLGVDKKKLTMVDSKGVITQHRSGLDKYKKLFATGREDATFDNTMEGADLFIGLSKGDILNDRHIQSMASKPIIFALANPMPEIDYCHAKEIRPDAIIATGRSDLPNQINNVLAFPYLFRGALDTLSTTINEPMKIAAAHAIAAIAREKVPSEIEKHYNNKFSFGHDYLLPKPGDYRLITEVSIAVAKAAMESGVARRDIASFKEYAATLLRRIEHENFFAREHYSRKTSRKSNYFSREREL